MRKEESIIQSKSEKEPTKEKGKDVEIIVSIIRHGEKTSEGKLSQLGLEKTKKMGEEKEIKNGIKGYASPFSRATETLDGILKGIKEQSKPQRVFKSRVRFELSPPKWNHFKEIISKAKDVEKSEGGAGLFRYMLSEPLVQEDLEHWTSGLAYLVNKYIRMANKLYSHSKVELLHITHDIVIGDFLRKVAIMKDDKGKRIDFNDIDVFLNVFGEHVKFLEGFNFEIYLDENREKHLKINFHDKPLEVDEEKLMDLVDKFQKKPYVGRINKQDWKKE